MANTVDLTVKLKALDKLSQPLKAITQSLKQTNDSLKALKKTQDDISAYKKQNAALKDTADKLNQAQEQVRSLRAQMKSGNEVTSKTQKQFKQANIAVYELSQKLKQQRQTLGEQRRALDASGISTRQLGNHETRIQAQIEQTTQRLKSQRQELKNIAAQEAKLANLREKHGKDMQHLAMVGAGGYAAMSGGKRALQAGFTVLPLF